MAMRKENTDDGFLDTNFRFTQDYPKTEMNQNNIIHDVLFD